MEILLAEVAAKSSRARAIRFALRPLLDSRPNRLRGVEVGTMFKLDEGLSTWVIAKAFGEACRDSQLWSFDMDPAHVESSKKIIEEHDPALASSDNIRWVQGQSLFTMRAILAEMSAEGETLDFAFLDGNGDPEYNLLEFEMLLPHMSRDFIILFDDFVYLKPSQAYPFRRPFGKAQAIFTMFLCRHLIEVTEFKADASGQSALSLANRSPLIGGLFGSEGFSSALCALDDLDFVILQTSMLAVGPRYVIAKLRDADPAHELLSKVVYGLIMRRRDPGVLHLRI